MSEFPQEPDGGEELSDEEPGTPSRKENNGDLWETNDEPVQGEQGQESV